MRQFADRIEWLCHVSVKLNVLDTVLLKNHSKVLILGIGHSTLAKDLKDKGYHHIDVADLKETSVSDYNRKLNPLYFDIRESIPAELHSQYDVVIDSSVTDVFMQLTTGTGPPPSTISTATKVHKRMLSMLKDDGVMIVFSMNRNPWSTIYKDSGFHRMHLRIRPNNELTKTSRGRLATSPRRPDVLAMVASRFIFLNIHNPIPSQHADMTEWSTSFPSDDEWDSER